MLHLVIAEVKHTPPPAPVDAARGIGEHASDPRMQSAVTLLVANMQPALAKLEQFLTDRDQGS